MPNNTGSHSVVFLERFILLGGIHTVLGFLLAFPLLLAAQRREPQRIAKYSAHKRKKSSKTCAIKGCDRGEAEIPINISKMAQNPTKLKNSELRMKRKKNR